MRLAVVTVLLTLALASSASAELPTYGITPPGPTYLRALEGSMVLGDHPQALLGDRWGSAWFIPNPGRFEIGVVGGEPGDDVRALVEASGFGDVVDFVAVRYTPQQELDAQNRLESLLMPLILQAKVTTGQGLDGAGLPSVILWWANNATEADQQLISTAVSGLGVSVAVTHVDRPDLFVLAERGAPARPLRPTSRARRSHPKPKHKRRRTRHAVRTAR